MFLIALGVNSVLLATFLVRYLQRAAQKRLRLALIKYAGERLKIDLPLLIFVDPLLRLKISSQGVKTSFSELGHMSLKKFPIMYVAFLVRLACEYTQKILLSRHSLDLLFSRRFYENKLAIVILRSFYFIFIAKVTRAL